MPYLCTLQLFFHKTVLINGSTARPQTPVSVTGVTGLGRGVGWADTSALRQNNMPGRHWALTGHPLGIPLAREAMCASCLGGSTDWAFAGPQLGIPVGLHTQTGCVGAGGDLAGPQSVCPVHDFAQWGPSLNAGWVH